MLGPTAPGKIGWRSEDHTAQRAQQFALQTKVREVRDADREVEPLDRQIAKPVEKLKINLRLWKLFHIFRNDRDQKVWSEQYGSANSQYPRGLQPPTGRLFPGFPYFRNCWLNPSIKFAASLAGATVSRRPVDQDNTDILLQRSERTADGLKRSAEAKRRLCQAAMIDD